MNREKLEEIYRIAFPKVEISREKMSVLFKELIDRFNETINLLESELYQEFVMDYDRIINKLMRAYNNVIPFISYISKRHYSCRIGFIYENFGQNYLIIIDFNQNLTISWLNIKEVALDENENNIDAYYFI